jgi:hypothetical protein
MENEYNGVETKMHRLDISGSSSSSYNNKNDFTEKPNDDESISFQAMIEWELNKRRGRSATYTQPLMNKNGTTSIDEEENIISFLSEFYNYQIYEKCYDMKQILHIYNDTVAVHYNTLVPNTCSFDEFWSRYYYRCSIVQVKKDLLVQRQKQLEQEQRQDEKIVDVPFDDDNNPIGNNKNNYNKSTANEIQLSSSTNNSSSTSTSNQTSITNTTTNTNRIQMFYQEYDRDIIEVIPEEDDDENDIDEKDLEQIKL